MALPGRIAPACLLLLLAACAGAPPEADQTPGADAEPARPAAAQPAPPQATTAAPPAKATAKAPTDTAFEGTRATVTPRSHIATIDRTIAPDDLWQRIRQGFAMPDIDSALVREKMAYYAARPEYLQRTFNRSRMYLYHIVEELEKRGMPTEIALLPMVESAFNPMAYSRAHASGIWQFIPGTGKRWELQQNWWYDGRRDIVESTNAALDYLQYLY
ncbi:MAG TPA: transglycosylase SLT domain-containing protein, partial [Burkholderiales bacterium]|nr:transglycosylase SLT domain-containing protein [Burkholderiales bacterium]